MRDRPTIEIDLNVRTRNNETYSGIEDADARVHVGQAVYVTEPEDGIIGDATVSRLDHARDLIYLAVDWSSLREIDDPDSAGGSG